MKPDGNDVMFFGGLMVLSVGCGLIYFPAGLIILGLGLIVMGAIGAIQKGTNP